MPGQTERPGSALKNVYNSICCGSCKTVTELNIVPQIYMASANVVKSDIYRQVLRTAVIIKGTKWNPGKTRSLMRGHEDFTAALWPVHDTIIDLFASTCLLSVDDTECKRVCYHLHVFQASVCVSFSGKKRPTGRKRNRLRESESPADHKWSNPVFKLPFCQEAFLTLKTRHQTTLCWKLTEIIMQK